MMADKKKKEQIKQLESAQ